MINISYENASGGVETGFAPISLVSGKSTEILTDPKGRKSISVGLEAGLTLRKLRLLIRETVTVAKKARLSRLMIQAADLVTSRLDLSDFELGKLLALQAELANFDFVQYKTEPKEGFPTVREIKIVGKVSSEFKKGVTEGQTIASEVNVTRTLANTPGGEMTPRILARAAKDAARGLPVTVRVLGRAQMQKLGMGAVLGVAAGSSEEPQFIVVEYWGAGNSQTARGGSDKRPIVLVGKGVTFDTGGLNLKPSEGIYEMHMDMSGGAAVIHSVIAAAKLKLKKNVVALVPAVENMPSGSSYRPGDVLRSMSGKTIEILNTDAEGRVILADGLFYAGKNYNPRLVIDVATLTGAAAIAFGRRTSAVFSTDEGLAWNLKNLGEATGDYVWPMPLWEEYVAEVKGTFGDWANLGKYQRYGGAIAGAVFLWQFTKDYPKDCPWVHIDIAPRMTPADDEYFSKGALGAPVVLLAELLKSF